MKNCSRMMNRWASSTTRIIKEIDRVYIEIKYHAYNKEKSYELVVFDGILYEDRSKYDDIVEDVKRMNFDDGVIDGELLAIGEFKDSAEGYKETMKRSRIKGDKTGLKVVAYDFIADINNFYKGRDNTPCYIRKMNLENLIRNSKTKFIEYLNPIYYGEIWILVGTILVITMLIRIGYLLLICGIEKLVILIMV